MAAEPPSMSSRLFAWLIDLWDQARSSMSSFCRHRAVLRRFVPLFEKDRNAVASVNSKIEAQFLATATSLEAMSELSDKLVDQAEGVFDVALGKSDSGSLQSPGGNLLEWLNELNTTQQQVHGVLSGIGQHQRRIERVLNQEKRLAQTVGTLQILPSLFKIESAPLTPDNRRLFMGLVQDIHQVHGKVSQTLRHSFETVGSMGRRLAEGRSRFTRFVETKCRAIDDRKGELEASLTENTRQLEANQKENISLLESTRETRQYVGQIVVALQFQDITRQKLQHIDGMREEIERALVRKKLSRRDVQFCLEAASLCQAHGDSVIHDLDTACTEIGGGIGEIEKRLGHLDETCLTLRQFSDLAISADGFIQKMLDASEELDCLTRDLVSGVGEMYDVLEPLSHALSGLSVTMGQVSAEIRLIALNAQVQAIQNGLGTGLEILSARTCDVADEMYRIGEEMSLALQDITVAVGSDLENCANIRDAGNMLLEKLETQGQDDANQLHAYRDRALDMLMGVYNVSNEISERTREVSAACSFDRMAKPALDQVNENLGELREVADRTLCSGRLPMPKGSTVEHFRSYYSIADEISTHNRVFGAPIQAQNRMPNPSAGGFQPLPLVPDQGASEGAFLFDDPPAPPPSSNPTTPNGSGSSGKTFKPAPSPAPAPAAANGGSDLGDNIELF